MSTKSEQGEERPFPPGVAKPAVRALAAAGYLRLDQLANAREADIAALHGMGEKALGILRAALKERGKSFRQ
ncbi:MAG: hypothetical protein WAM85_08170 [Terracidiphilus sp.]